MKIFWKEFCKKFCRKWFFFQNNFVENSLICPKNKSLNHCPTELFPIYSNNHWTIRRRDDHIVVPSSNRIKLKIDWIMGESFVPATQQPSVLYWRLSDFIWILVQLDGILINSLYVLVFAWSCAEICNLVESLTEVFWRRPWFNVASLWSLGELRFHAINQG